MDGRLKDPDGPYIMKSDKRPKVSSPTVASRLAHHHGFFVNINCRGFYTSGCPAFFCPVQNFLLYLLQKLPRNGNLKSHLAYKEIDIS